LASPCKHENKVSYPRPPSTRPLERQFLTSRRRRPASSSSRSPLTSWARPARPLPHLLPPPSRARGPPPRALAPPWHALAPRRLVPPPSQTAWWRAPLRPPQAMVLLPPESAPVTGEQAPTYRGEPAPYHLPPPPLPRPTTSTPLSRARKVPVTRTAETLRSFAPGAPGAARCALFCDPPAPALTAAPRAQARGTEAWVGRTTRCSRAPSAGGQANP
jgi:hypothetical protein